MNVGFVMLIKQSTNTLSSNLLIIYAKCEKLEEIYLKLFYVSIVLPIALYEFRLRLYILVSLW